MTEDETDRFDLRGAALVIYDLLAEVFVPHRRRDLIPITVWLTATIGARAGTGRLIGGAPGPVLEVVRCYLAVLIAMLGAMALAHLWYHLRLRLRLRRIRRA